MKTVLDEIVTKLKETGEKLTQENPEELPEKYPENNAFLIYESVRFINENTKNSKDKNLVFLGYFLHFFRRDVWTNIAVESSYRVDDETSRKLLRIIGGEFKILSTALKDKNYAECYNVYARLVYAYLEIIEKLKKMEVVYK